MERDAAPLRSLGTTVLSILVPAYNQPEGVERILRGLTVVRGWPNVEILVSDDSTEPATAQRIQAVCDDFGGIGYVHNRPGLGAVANWNALLRRARGEYCWLLHHDEEPAPGFDLPALLKALADRNAADAWVLPCHVVHSPGARARLHFPAHWAVAVVRRWPGYLLRRNLIGSPSALVVRRRCYELYDQRLQWRVDVEAYVRMLASPVRLSAWPLGGVISNRDSTNSITAKLAVNLASVEAREQELLRATYADRTCAGRWVQKGVMASARRLLESIAWASFRSAYRAVQQVQDVWS